MTRAEENIVHIETMPLQATPAQVKAFIMTPERILDYFPQPIEGGVLEQGKAIFCRGEMVTSMLEVLASESEDDCVVVKVTTAFGLDAPYTRERIETAANFTMVEDWNLAETATGTTLTKTWRDVTSIGPEPFLLAEAVREGAIQESDALIRGWNNAAQQGHP